MFSSVAYTTARVSWCGAQSGRMLGRTPRGSDARERLDTEQPVGRQEFGARRRNTRPTDPKQRACAAAQQVAASTDSAEACDKFARSRMQDPKGAPRMVCSRTLIAFWLSSGHVNRIRRRAADARTVGTGGSPACPAKRHSNNPCLMAVARNPRIASHRELSSITSQAPEPTGAHRSRYRQASGTRPAR